MYMYTFDPSTAVIVLGFLGAACVAYGINRLNAGKSEERKLKHAEFNSSRVNLHEEKMASIVANRDIEISKATKKEPTTVLNQEQRTIEHDA